MPETQTPQEYTPLRKTPLGRFMTWSTPAMFVLAIASVIVALLVPWRVHTTDDLSAKQLALDAAARERAGEFVRQLGFEPGPAVCHALDSGSAWCTVRVAGSDKTFSLWCSRRHLTCIENLARE
jgi:hypothetical protein